jgi:hypothetical protein
MGIVGISSYNARSSTSAGMKSESGNVGLKSNGDADALPLVTDEEDAESIPI